MRKLIVMALITIFMGVPAAYAQSLDQMAQQLQEKPDDDALREQVIKQALEENAAIPEEARRHFVKGSAIAQSAKDAAGQKLAIESFRDALKIAPWWGDAYYNMAVAQELAGDYTGARKSLQNYILTNPGEKEAREAQDRVYTLEGKQALAKTETTAKKAAEDTPQKRQKSFLDKLDGAVFSYVDTLSGDPGVGRADSYYRRTILIRNGQIATKLALWYAGQNEPSHEQGNDTGTAELAGKTVSYTSTGDIDPACNPITLSISDDGSKITRTYTCYGQTYTFDFFRVN